MATQEEREHNARNEIADPSETAESAHRRLDALSKRVKALEDALTAKSEKPKE